MNEVNEDKTKRPMEGWSYTTFGLEFIRIGRKIYFDRNPADYKTIANSREYRKAQAEFAADYCMKRMVEDLGVRYDKTEGTWRKV